MYYYKSTMGDTITGITRSLTPLNVSGFIQISKGEFDSLVLQFGSPVIPGSISPQDLQEENKLLKAQLQAQIERSDFIEDCIAEMATIVYGGE